MTRSARMLPAIPYTVLRDAVPGRMAMRVIEKAFTYGWHDERAEGDLVRGRQAIHGDRWLSTPGLDADLISHRRRAFAWLATEATPLGHELRDYDEAIVLIGRSDIL